MLDISLTENVDESGRKLNEFQPDLITGYPSVMGSLAKAADAGKLKIHPQAVACSAEKLKDNVYQALKDTFGCPILNNYCSTEGGEAAMEMCIRDRLLCLLQNISVVALGRLCHRRRAKMQVHASPVSAHIADAIQSFFIQ